MSQVTHASQIVKQLEYVEETTYRTFPTNPLMVFLAEVAKWTPEFDMSAKGFKRHGSEDIYKVLQGKQMFKSTFEFGVSNSTFLKYAILATAGAGTINKSLSIGFSQKIDNTENYVKLTGSRIERLRISSNPDTPEIKVVADMIHSDIVTPTTTSYIGTGTHATASTTAPWTFADGGVDPITWGGSAIQVVDINAEFGRKLANKWVQGDQKIKFQYPISRDILGDITVEWLGTAREADMKANTARALAWVLKTATSTISWTNAYLIKLSDRAPDAEADDSNVEKFGFLAESVTVT